MGNSNIQAESAKAFLLAALFIGLHKKMNKHNLKQALTILIICVLLVFPSGCETLKKHSEKRSTDLQEPVVIVDGDYSKLDYDTIYRHVSELLEVEKKTSPFAKLIKGKDIYRYKVCGLCKFVSHYNKKYAQDNNQLDCSKLLKNFYRLAKMLGEISGIDMQMHQSGTLVFRFITDKTDIKMISRDDVIKTHFPAKKGKQNLFLNKVYTAILKNNGIVRFDSSIGEVMINKQIFYTYIAVYGSINPLNASKFINDEIMNSIFLKVLYDGIVRVSPSRVIPGTLMSIGSKYTTANISEFDIALLKAVFSDKIGYRIERKNAAKKISDLVYAELRR